MENESKPYRLFYIVATVLFMVVAMLVISQTASHRVYEQTDPGWWSYKSTWYCWLVSPEDYRVENFEGVGICFTIDEFETFGKETLRSHWLAELKIHYNQPDKEDK